MPVHLLTPHVSRILKVLAMLLVALICASLAQAQITNVTADQTTPTPGVGHDYIQLLSETVDPSMGSLSIRIGVQMPEGRGLTLPFAFAYDSSGVHIPRSVPFSGTVVGWTTNIGALSQGGWSYSLPTLSHGYGYGNDHINGVCYWTMDYVFQDPSGGRHALALGTAREEVKNSGACDSFAKSNVLSGGDTLSSATPLTVADRAGTVYNFNPGSVGGSTGSYASQVAVSSVEDRNGNIITITGTGSQGFKIADTVGRTVLASNGFGTTGNGVTVPGLAYPYILTWGTANSNFTVGIGNPTSSPNCASAFGADSETQPVVRSIQLPNKQQYTFTYDSDDPSIAHPFGLITQITYPSGGWVKYTWTLNQLSTRGVFNDGGVQQILPVCPLTYDTPAVATRTVSFDGQNPAQVQTFSYYTTWPTNSASWSSKNTAVITQDSIRGGVFETDYTYVPVTIGDSPNDEFAACNYPGCNQVPVENTITYKDWNGSILKAVTKAWQNQYLLTDETTQIGTGSSAPTSSTHYVYYPAAQGFQLQEKDEYDFGSGAKGALLGKTIINYASFPATPIYPSGPSIFDKPCQTIAYDGGGNRVGETDYLYDGGTSVCGAAGTPSTVGVSNLPTGTHDETYYAASSTTSRGNPTTLTKKCLQSCADSVTSYSYDETGQVLTSKDASLNTTSYSYTDNYTADNGIPTGNTNAYATTITKPTTNNVSHISKFQYGFEDGKLRSISDENSQVTTYCYWTGGCSGPKAVFDPFLRLAGIKAADGGQTTINYNDAGPSPSVTTSSTIDSTLRLLTRVSVYDALGHRVETELTSDSPSTTYTATSYDGAGMPYKIWNPTRCFQPTTNCGEATWGFTTYTYDALGRATQVTNPDNTTILTTYTGRATQVQDEGNGTQRVTRISQSDALGRLNSICEVAPGPFVGSGGASSPSLMGQSGTPAACGQDIPAQGFLTTYTYDALGNLLQANQGTMRARSFNYDSLGRLLCASNPENSSAACPSTATGSYTLGTTAYTYDANSNLLTKTTPAPNQTGTATVTTTYAHDALNRLLSKSYNDGKTPTATFVYDASTVITSLTNPIGRLVESSGGPGIANFSQYDSMGRVSQQWQYTPMGGQNAFSFPYTYDYLGNMTSASDGYFHGYSYAYNTAGRLTGLTSSLSNSQNPGTLLSSVLYTPAGKISSDTLGTSEVETYSYTKRNQLQAETAKLSATQTYAYSLTFASNGNVIASTDSVNGNWAYSYDQFNRLVCTNLATNGTCASPTSGTPTYSYVNDRFGNRWQQNGPHAMIETFTGNNSTNNNRMDGYSYDAAGNLLNDGVNFYTYDAENRIVQVQKSGPTGVVIATYLYDADGKRVHRTGVISDTCDASGKRDYTYDLAGHWTLEVTSSGTACKTEIYAGTRHFVTNGGGTYFDHSDWLGTVRARNTYAGPTSFETCTSLPFGDALTCIGGDQSTIHFTGKERDTESGNDYFGARYYASSMGRFMSPDWSAKAEPVPYAKLDDPQSLNLYAYVRNKPLSRTDKDGHCDMSKGLCQFLNFLGCFCAPVRPMPLPAGTADAVNQLAQKATSAVALTGAVIGKVSQLQANKQQGKDFEQSVVEKTRGTDSNVSEQVTVKTASGTKTRLDVVSNDPSGNVRMQEAKSSETAPLTANQAAAFPEIQQSGATVVGQGKPGFPGGTQIPPTEVEIIRPPILPE